jgi:hypothetical protein
MQNTVVQNGVGLGTVIAVVASWHRNRSILWAILHGVLSWLYVIYFALTEKKEEGAVRDGRAGLLVVAALLLITTVIAFAVIAAR